ncbi:mitochondrial carrier protein [Chloropicon primus]|uniref:Mitochondrial carrier protein n=1 Tax=Chloropicon primus TaxID=1764295 RepID=A0A5B8MXS5_9CHLO|nr:mitochondrial carrier protein [Chloropicon primus]UPR04135.1 mitochondrial carrier protein [Chloropicon primus]|eukprot:QDZ24926.1 mitochondrial carrier protein [Chloropicon primus]
MGSQINTPSPSMLLKPLKYSKDVVAGTCGGIVVTLIGHPFDTLKVRLQAQSIANPVYSGVVDCFKQTVSKEGVRGLYKGMSSPLAGQMAFRASLFTAFAQSKKFLAGQQEGGLTQPQFFIAGGMTGAVISFTEGPVDFYKSQMQVQAIKAAENPGTLKQPSMVETVRSSIRHNGIRGPFQGVGATMLRNIPANAVYLGSFEYFKSLTCEKYSCKPSDLSVPALFSMGGLAGSLYWALLFPADVVKSRMQSDSIVKSERTYKTIPGTIKSLYRQGGIKVFYRGFLPCMMRSTPANGIMLMTVDKVRNYIDGL